MPHLNDMISKFNARAQSHFDSQMLNPFSDSFCRRSPSPKPGQQDYGRPLAGSKTEMRGLKAQSHVNREVLELCETIVELAEYNLQNLKRAQRQDPNFDEEIIDDGNVIVSFGELFDVYARINDKLVGLLLAAKKKGLLHFDKEILFQRRDDDELIALIKPIQEIRQVMKLPSKSPSPMPLRECHSDTDSDATDPAVSSCSSPNDTVITANGDEKVTDSEFSISEITQENTVNSSQVVTNGEIVVSSGETKFDTTEVDNSNVEAINSENATVNAVVSHEIANDEFTISGQTNPDIVNVENTMKIVEKTNKDESTLIIINEATAEAEQVENTNAETNNVGIMIDESAEFTISGQTNPDIVNAENTMKIVEKANNDESTIIINETTAEAEQVENTNAETNNVGIMIDESAEFTISGQTNPDIVNAENTMKIMGKTNNDESTIIIINETTAEAEQVENTNAETYNVGMMSAETTEVENTNVEIMNGETTQTTNDEPTNIDSMNAAEVTTSSDITSVHLE